MKKLRKVQKLQVSRETLRNLDGSQLKQAAGGVTAIACDSINLCYTERCTTPTCRC